MKETENDFENQTDDLEDRIHQLGEIIKNIPKLVEPKYKTGETFEEAIEWLRKNATKAMISSVD